MHVEFLSFGFWQVIVRRPCLDNMHGAFWSWICKRNLMTWNMYELQWSFIAYHFTLNWKVGCKTFGLNWIELRWKVFLVKETPFCMVKWACMSHITSRMMTRQCLACPWQMVNCLMMFGRFIVLTLFYSRGRRFRWCWFSEYDDNRVSMFGSLHDRIRGQWTTLWLFFGNYWTTSTNIAKKCLLPFWKNVPSFSI
jgi:hypothetical protein